MSRYLARNATRQYKPHEAVEAFASDAQMISDAIHGSKALLEAIVTGQGPDCFAWRDHSPNWKPDKYSMTSGFMVHRVNLIQEREARAESLRVNREPCGVCGTRTDIGCKHQRVA